LLAATSAIFAQSLSNGGSGQKLDAGLDAAVNRAVRSYDRTSGGFVAKSPGQGYFSTFTNSGALTLNSSKSTFSVQAVAFGRGVDRGSIGNTTPFITKDAGGWPQLSFARQNLSEWYVNGENGLHHWLQVSQRPGSAGTNLWVKLAVTGSTSLKQLSNDAIQVQAGSSVFAYSGLKVWDARGVELNGRLSVSGQAIAINIDDTGAKYPITIDPTWTQQQKLTAADGISSDIFGSAVAIDGDTAVVGASGPPNVRADISDGESSFTPYARAYVFTRTAGVWSLQQKIQASDLANPDQFGYSVGISGNTVVVGAPLKATSTGAAYIYTRSGATWTQRKKLTASNGATGDKYGTSVSISGNTVVVGASSKSTSNGSVYVYTGSGATWTEQQILTASDAANNSKFGDSVSVSGDTLASGSPTAGGGFGATYVFTRTAGAWSQQQKITASGGASTDQFGFSVSLDGDQVAIGTGGAEKAYIFTRSGSVWSQLTSVTGSDTVAGDKFGTSVGLSNDTLAVGAYAKASSMGAVYAFRRQSGVWYQSQKLTASDGAAGDQLGFSVAASNNTFVSGAKNANSLKGASYVFLADPIVVSLAFSPASVIGGTSSSLTINLTQPAPTGGLVVSLTSNLGAVTVPSTVTVPAGQTSTSVTIPTTPVAVDGTAQVTATAFDSTGGSANLAVKAPVATGISFSPTWVYTGDSSTGTITFSGPIPTGGMNVSLGSTNPAIPVQSGVSATAGSTSATFNLSGPATSSDLTTSVSATLGDTVSTSFTVKRFNPMSFSFPGPGVAGGRVLNGTVTLADPAPAGGFVVNFVSSDAVFPVPASVTVPAGATSAIFPVATQYVSIDHSVTITASGPYADVQNSFTILVRPPRLWAVQISTPTVNSQGTVIGTAILTAPQPVDTLVTLNSSNSSALSVPATITILAGQRRGTFTATAGTVGSVTNVVVSGTMAGLTRNTTVSVQPEPAITSLILQDSVIKFGTSTTGTVGLAFPAGPGGVVVTLASTNPSVSVPASVTVPQGSTSAPFTATSMGMVATSTVISATVNDSVKTASLKIVRPKLASVSVSPSTVQGGTDSMLTVTLQAPAPVGGVSVNLKSFQVNQATVPASVMVPAGSTSVTVTVTTYRWTKPTPKVVTLAGNIIGDNSKTTSLTVTN
jgi:hypothetical protein